MEAIWALTNIILRVPPLFVIDDILKTEINFPIEMSNKNNAEAQIQMVQNIVLSGVQFIITITGCVCSLCVFMLPKDKLLLVYRFIFSVLIVILSYLANSYFIHNVLENYEQEENSKLQVYLITKIFNLNGYLFEAIRNLLLQLTIGCIFAKAHLGKSDWMIDNLLMPSFLLPYIFAFLPVPPYVLKQSPTIGVILPLAALSFVVWANFFQTVETFYNGYKYAARFASNFGVTALLENEWVRLNVPTVLRTFWILRVLEHAFISNYGCFFGETTDSCSYNENTTWFSIPKDLLIKGCETQTTVLGMTSIVSHICHYIGSFFQWILLTNDDDDRSIGTVSAILFFILALQTGLTSLEPEKRFIRLCRNFCLLFTALLHFIHNIVNPLLMSLSASHNPATHRHVRALAVCAFLVIFPVGLLFYLWSQHSMSTWLLAVSAFSVEVIVKVVVSLMIYSLFLIDAYRTTFWETLDDYVYYIRAFGNTVEFCFGIFLFFNGAWILVFESGGAIRAIMMCIHAYFNIWCEARAGWSVFIKRRTAVKKINSLPEATTEQLAKLDDVCAICYQEMSSAKITRCRHFFHGVCLRKWLYVQDRCPLCHKILHQITEDDDPDADDEEGELDEYYDPQDEGAALEQNN